MIRNKLKLIRAEGWCSRARGLLFRAKLSGDEGLWLYPCNAVHTVGMRYPLALFYLDHSYKVIRHIEEIKPYRFSWNHHAQSVIETLSSEKLTIQEVELALELFRCGR